ncbi:PKHD-type hydroxylase cce_3668 [Candidatus Terasakiella magnetica]|uniref:PKHD-type hydroxylase cce_3668 n=1 Tax=Candidatus Terasakiella magnetica TaxID=1867952 RepID=A0A1C3RM00_9PROT|nr:Fe2+-dependent dioxygenase [Candidatus Terasakiella magnetica]SCA58307.1 PKHD-type hydroxylase cce_3668 [Candidatus Terasakiella magnetica]
MIIPLPNLLSDNQVKTIMGLVGSAQFEDGKNTAGWHAREVKNNEQMTQSEPLKEINQILSRALQLNELFNFATHPHIIRPFLVSRCKDQGSYGTHIDNALMFHERTSRTDISMTVFLSPPNSYEGGDLVIEEPAAERRFRMAAGSAIVYPSTTLHRVEPVTKGERIVACTWVQSRIRSAEQREILFDMDTARRSLFQKDGKSREFDLMTKAHANLMRRWSDV